MENSKISVLILEPLAKDGILMLESQENFNVDVSLNLTRAELIKKIPNYDCIIVRSQTNVDKELLQVAKNLKFIGRAGVGINNIDINFAKEKNIAVVNTPSGNSVSTAEFTFGLMISLMRNIPHAKEHLQMGKWERKTFKGFELAHKTLGIIGFGNVGRLLSSRAKAFDMRVIACDPLVDRSVIYNYGAQKLARDEVIASSDIISLHCNLSSDTLEIINAKTISNMKDGVYIINAARGELINNKDTFDALQNNKIRGLALDVYPKEPPDINDPLLKHERVIATPHIGASTHEAQKKVSTIIAEQAINFFNDSLDINRVC